MLPGFDIEGFWSAVFGAILYGLIAWALCSLCALIPDKKG
jgi:putative membrane protein